MTCSRPPPPGTQRRNNEQPIRSQAEAVERIGRSFLQAADALRADRLDDADEAARDALAHLAARLDEWDGIAS